MARNLIRLLFWSEATGFGGGEQVLVTLLNGLSPSEFNVFCACSSMGTLEAISKRVSRTEVEFHWVPCRKPLSIVHTVVPMARRLRTLRPQVLHVNAIDVFGGAYAVFAARLAGVPVVVGTIHTALGHPQRTFLQGAFGRVVDHLTDAAILVSEYCRGPVARDRHFGPAKIHVIRNGVSASVYSSIDLPDLAVRQRSTCRIGIAARLVKEKGIDVFLQSIALIPFVDDFEVVIAGDGPEKASLQSLATALGIDRVVSFLGWQDDVRPVIAALDILVLSSYNESLPMVLLEAMAFAVPVVATHVGGIPEVVAHGVSGLLVPPGDPKALAEAIESLIRNAALRHAMGEAGRERVKIEFDAKRMVRETAQLYRHLLFK